MQRKVNFSEGSFHRPKQQKSDERKEGGLRNRRKVFELAKWPKYELIHFFFRSNSSKKFKLVHRSNFQRSPFLKMAPLHLLYSTLRNKAKCRVDSVVRSNTCFFPGIMDSWYSLRASKTLYGNIVVVSSLYHASNRTQVLGSSSDVV